MVAGASAKHIACSPSKLLMNGNGHTVVDDAGDSYFQVNGSVSATFADTTFEGFHGTVLAPEVRYRGVILKLGVCTDYIPIEHPGC